MRRVSASGAAAGGFVRPPLLAVVLPAAFVVLWFVVTVAPSNVQRVFGGILLGAILGGYAYAAKGRIARRILIVLLALAPLTQAVFYLPALWNRPLDGTDARVYWRAAERAKDPDAALYVPIPDGPHVFGSPDYYLYPPFLAAAITVLPSMSERAFDRFWVAAMLAMLWAFAVGLSFLALGRVTVLGVLAWGMIVSLWPGALFGALIGNVEPLLWALGACALASARLRGGAFVASALIKPYAAWPALVALARERGRPMRSAAVVLIASVALAASVFGISGMFRTTIDWIAHVYPSLSQGQMVVPNPDFWWISGNLSLSFLPLKIAHFIFGWTPDGDLPAVLRLYLTFASVAPVVVVAWLARHRSVELHCALVLSTAVAFGPICRMSYTPIFLTVAAILWRERTFGHRFLGSSTAKHDAGQGVAALASS